MMTSNRMQRHWTEVKSFIQTNWPKFTEQDLEKVKGDFDQFLFYLKELYGGFPKTEADARTRLQLFLNRLDEEHPERVTLTN